MSEDHRVLLGLRDIQERRWFEAHEELELAWRESTGERRQWLQGLIQGAVALEHLRRANPRGAWGQWRKARDKLEPLAPDFGGVHIGPWLAALTRFYAAIDLDERSRRQVAKEDPAGLPPLPPEEHWPLPRYEPWLLRELSELDPGEAPGA